MNYDPGDLEIGKEEEEEETKDLEVETKEKIGLGEEIS